MELSKENWKVIYLALEDYITKLEEEYGEGIDKIVYDTYSLSVVNKGAEIGLWEVINTCNSCDLVSTKLHPTTGYCPECQTQTEQGEN